MFSLAIMREKEDVSLTTSLRHREEKNLPSTSFVVRLCQEGNQLTRTFHGLVISHAAKKTALLRVTAKVIALRLLKVLTPLIRV